MLKLNSKLSGKVYLFLFLLLSVISCEVENAENAKNSMNSNDTSKAVATTFTSNAADIHTQEMLNGVWESFDSGSKSKWIFEGNELLKSNIYSFGEAGTPQKYTVQVQSTCGGKMNDTGKYLSLILNDSDNDKGMCYEIVSHSASEIKLASKHGHSITLKKED